MQRSFFSVPFFLQPHSNLEQSACVGGKMVKLQRKIREIPIKVKGGGTQSRGSSCFWGPGNILFLHPGDGYMGLGFISIHATSLYVLGIFLSMISSQWKKKF